MAINIQTFRRTSHQQAPQHKEGLVQLQSAVLKMITAPSMQVVTIVGTTPPGTDAT
jgi:hypothetical protein